MPPSQDPNLPTAREAVDLFKNKVMSAEDALQTIWKMMNVATHQGFPTQPYVDLSDAVTFPDERHDVDPDKEMAAAEWMAELATREPEND